MSSSSSSSSSSTLAAAAGAAPPAAGAAAAAGAAPPAGMLPSCQPCQCYPIGTNLDEETTLPICNGYTGDCLCKPHVIGRNCEKCADGYFNLESGEGCEPCNC